MCDEKNKKEEFYDLRECRESMRDFQVLIDLLPAAIRWDESVQRNQEDNHYREIIVHVAHDNVENIQPEEHARVSLQDLLSTRNHHAFVVVPLVHCDEHVDPE